MVANNTNIPAHTNAILALTDGSIFYGQGIGAQGTTVGEICFNTGITGYQEILTDLSYAGQIITFTFPHIGNTGTNNEDIESAKPAAKGLIIRESISNPSNFRSQNHLNEWLLKQKITGISGIDTRALTKHIRNNGPQNAAICNFQNTSPPDIQNLIQQAQSHPPLKGMELAKSVTSKNSHSWQQSQWQLSTGFQAPNNTKHKVIAIDYGAKLNILRCLTELGCDVTVVPATTTADHILKLNPNGIFLSNGPGDPKATGEYAITEIQKLINSNIPIFGICLGHQLLSLALGCTTTKMTLGHRGSNHPVQNLETQQVEITSQNHGFVVEKNTLPHNVQITHISLFDNTIEGIHSTTHPVFSVQHHPEASPGPHDSFYLFKKFIDLMEKNHA